MPPLNIFVDMIHLQVYTKYGGRASRKDDVNMAKLIRVDKNGTKYYEGMVTCPKCGGVGLIAHHIENGQPSWNWTDGGVCWKCLGAGKVKGKWVERTPEYQAKLDAKHEAKRKAWQAKMDAEREERERKEAEEKRKEEERLAEIKAQKALSQYVGEIGQRIEITATYEYTASWEQKVYMGYGTETKHCHGFRDDQGNVLVWFTTKGIYNLEKGDKVLIKAIVKTHSEYKDEKQTGLKNCKIVKEEA